jgi:hypothetical protein
MFALLVNYREVAPKQEWLGSRHPIKGYFPAILFDLSVYFPVVKLLILQNPAFVKSLSKVG